MKISIVMNLINISGNALLVYALKFGVDGVAIPTLLSRMYAAVAAFVLVHNKRYLVRCSYPVKVKPDFHMLKKILGIGIPNGLENSMFQLGKIMVLSMITQFGTASIAANAVSNTIAVFQTLPGMAIGNAVLTVSAQCAGAGDYEQVKYYAKKLHIIIYGLMIVCCLGVMNLTLAEVNRLFALCIIEAELLHAVSVSSRHFRRCFTFTVCLRRQQP